MCGRYALTAPKRLAESGMLDALRLDAVGDEVPQELLPRWNVAPGTPILAALARAVAPADRPGGARRTERRLELLRWGLIPSWAKDAAIGHRLVNARAEGIAETPSYRGAWRAGRRCLVPADAFYEWQDVGAAEADPRNGDPGTTGRRPVARRRTPKQPWAFAMADDAPFALAGLWEVWRDRSDPAAGEAAPLVPSCVLVTTAANAVVRPVHERMPVIVPAAAWDRWLDPRTPAAEAAALLAPYPADAMRAWRVGLRVNDPRHDAPDVLAPLAPLAPDADAPVS